jgi:hypothetical protein|tara:strand:+ start:491 stop:664 length:174 start_codon:yes stop_codon:yes gene_type:complete
MSNKGLGDIVEAAIKRATFGRVRPKKDCGCEKRKQWLNEKGNNALNAIDKIQNRKTG